MDILIVGGGAMGGLWSAHLAAVGHDVTIFDVSIEVADAITRDGLSLMAADGHRTVPVRATADPSALQAPSIAYVFTKAHHTRGAAEMLARVADADTTVVSLQNGWGNSAVIAEFIDPARMAFGVTYHSARVDAPGKVAHTSTGRTVVGPYLAGSDPAASALVASTQDAAGLATDHVDPVAPEIWKKVVLNTATLPTSALTGLFAGELGEPGPMLDLADDIARESVAVLRAAGYDIDAEERVAAINGLLGRAGRGKASMLQDVEARRRTEIDVINGAILREATRLGIDAPLNRAMVALIGGLERTWDREDAA